MTTIASRRKYPHFRDGETEARDQAPRWSAEKALANGSEASSPEQVGKRGAVRTTKMDQGTVPGSWGGPCRVPLPVGLSASSQSFHSPRESLIYETEWVRNDEQRTNAGPLTPMVINAAVQRSRQGTCRRAAPCVSDEEPAPGKPRGNKSVRDREQARRGPRLSRAAVQMSAVPGVAVSEHTARPRLGRPRGSVTAQTDARALDLPSLDRTIQRAVTSTAVRDVKTQPIHRGGGGQMPAERPLGRLWSAAQTPDRQTRLL